MFLIKITKKKIENKINVNLRELKPEKEQEKENV